nr:MAG TPA: hypothetical protein [Caudoviricetes sp.]
MQLLPDPDRPDCSVLCMVLLIYIFSSARDQPFGLPPYNLGRIGPPVPRDTRAL